MKVGVETIRADWRASAFPCELLVDAPDQQWEGFVHAADELVIVLGGHTEYKIEGKIMHPAIGEEPFIRSGTVHSVRNIGRTKTSLLYGYGRAQ